jgi:hypothetical protein
MAHRTTVAALILLSIPLLVLQSGCPAKPAKVTPPPTSKPAPAPPPPAPTPPKITFVDSQPSDATVVLDGQEMGTISELMAKGGLVVTAGVHRIEVRRSGYSPYRVELKVKETGERLTVLLSKRKRHKHKLR